MAALQARPHHDALGSAVVSYESVTPRSPAAGPSAEEIAAKSFPTARRGFDPDSVHRYLMEVATTLRDARRREDLLRSRIDALERAEPRLVERPVEEDGLAEALGAETVKVLQAAREAARDLIARGERRANALVAEAEASVAERTRDADEAANALLARTRAEASQILESTRSQARSMVDEAREARRRILTDLSERRRVLHLQLEQLRAGKEALSGVLDRVSESMLTAMDDVRNRLGGAEAQARSAAQAAAQDVRFSDDDLQIDTPPRVDAPSVSAELAEALGGSRTTPESAPLAFDETGDAVETRRPSELQERTSGGERRQGIDELFARIRESRQLEVAETRAQIEAVERELSAPLPPPVAKEPEPRPATGATAGFYDAVAIEEQERAEAATLFSPVVDSDDADEDVAAPAPVVESPVAPPSPPTSATAAPESQSQLHLDEPSVEVADVADVVEVQEASPPEADGDEELARPLTIFERRDHVLTPSAVDLGRALKRTLRVEQNELLDAARHLKRPQEALALLPAEPMASRVSAAVLASLQSAWHAGSDFVSDLLGEHERPKAVIEPEGQTEIAEISRLLAVEIVEPIRRRMEQGLIAAGNESASISEAVTAGFRDWRASKLDEVATDYADRVFARSIVSASRERKLKLSWVVDDGGTNCPDCDDNALSGPTIAGSLFPTGHSHPPIHPACHCVLIPVRE